MLISGCFRARFLDSKTHLFNWGKFRFRFWRRRVSGSIWYSGKIPTSWISLHEAEGNQDTNWLTEKVVGCWRQWTKMIIQDRIIRTGCKYLAWDTPQLANWIFELTSIYYPNLGLIFLARRRTVFNCISKRTIWAEKRRFLVSFVFLFYSCSRSLPARDAGPAHNLSSPRNNNLSKLDKFTRAKPILDETNDNRRNK